MAKDNSIGGFFVELGALIDKPSFETGNKLIDGLTDKTSKLIATARNAGVVLTGMAVASGTLESKAYKTSEALGITVEEMNTWTAAAKIAGVNSNGLMSSMGKLASTLNHIKIDGSGLAEYSKQLSKLGMGISDLQDAEGNWLSADDAYAQILRTAQAKYAKADEEEKLRLRTIVGDILGTEGQGLFIELERKGQTIDEYLQQARATQYTTNQNNQDAQDFITEVRILGEASKSLGKLLGDEVAGKLTGHVQAINQWVQDNGDQIKQAVGNIAKVVGTIADNVSRLAKKLAPAIEWLISPAEQKSDLTRVNNQVTSFRKGMFGDVDWASLDDFTKQNVADYYKKYGNINNLGVKSVTTAELEAVLAAEQARINALNKANKSKTTPYDPNKEWWLQDGIMRPDGTITHVAPDDWVFAARNVGDLAKAFLPRNMNTVNAPASYIINQSFNINGSRDIPQVLKQQAYLGTQQGLQDIMAQSSHRMQLMSGTR